MYLAPDPKNKPDPVVVEIQRKLNAIGKGFHHNNWKNLDDDGIYGKDTATVVGLFQKAKGITSTSTTLGPILGDTTIQYIRQEYMALPGPSISTASSHLVPAVKSDFRGAGKTGLDLVALLASEGGPLYKELAEAFPLVFKKISGRAERPMFVFSKNEAYRSSAKYKRINVPDSVSRYLGIGSLLWSWFTIGEEIKEYKQKLKTSTHQTAETLRLGGNIFSMCTASVDTILSMPIAKSLAGKMAGKYVVAETGATIGSLTGAAALSTVGQAIGAFLLGWEIGTLLGKIPVGNGRVLQDVIDEFLDLAWEHPYRTLGLNNPIASVIVMMKTWTVVTTNWVSCVKTPTPEEMKKIDEYLKQHPEQQYLCKPPRFAEITRGLF